MQPARAPASIDMLQTVIRSSMESARTAVPVYSITCPVPPATPIRAITARVRSFAVTPGRSFPSTRTCSVRGRRCSKHCVASTWATSLVPMPKAKAPKAPWVLVWLSPQTMVMPGCERPSSGPITCTIPCCSLASEYSSTPNWAQFVSSAASCAAHSRSSITSFVPGWRGVVGVE